jgi:3-oxoacyl-[acyl-carrier-protein] synthase III
MKLESSIVSKHQHRSALRPKVRVESLGVSGDYIEGGVTGLESAIGAVDRCFSNSAYSKDDVDLIIFCGVYRAGFVFEPAIAAMLAREARIGGAGASRATQKQIFAFDVFNGAAGFLSACGIGAQMISAGQAKTALIVAAETKAGMEDSFSRSRGIAETASAALLEQSSSEGPGFESFMFRNFRQYQNSFTSRGWAKPGRPELRYQSNGDIAEAYLAAIAQIVPDFQANERFDLSKVSFVLGPQLGKNFSHRLSKVLDLPAERLVDVGREDEDLFTSSFSYGLHYLERNRLAKPGNLVLTLSVGLGVQVGCATYRF